MNKRILSILIGIFFIGLCFRFVKLGDIPKGLHRDEAFLGYNAYSILQTGKDMTGSLVPLHFKSFLYSPAGYSYFSIPFIALFGLSPFSIRFASAFFGGLTIVVTYFLIIEAFKESRDKNLIGLFASFLLAISPWGINLARTATENTLVVFFNTCGLLLFLIWRRKKNFYYVILSFFCFLITFFTYQASRSFIPFFIPMLILFFWGKNFLSKQKIITMFFLFLLLTIPVITILSSNSLSLRLKTVSVFYSPQTQLILEDQIRNDGVQNMHPYVTRLFHNKIIGYSSQVFQNYFKHFSYDFLFTEEGFPLRYKVPLNGILYLFELPFLLVGLYMLIKEKNKLGLFFIFWVLIAPIGSALASDDIPNLQRTYIIFPALSIVSAFGLKESYIFLAKHKLKTYGILIFIAIMAYQISYYVHQYMFHVNRYRPWYRNDGYKELVSKVDKLLPQYRKAIITNRESAPTVFFLFFSKYSPILFQEQILQKNVKDYDRIEFGKYFFSEEECPLKYTKNLNQPGSYDNRTLFVNSGLCTVPSSAHVLDTVKREDGSLVFVLLEKNEDKSP